MAQAPCENAIAISEGVTEVAGYTSASSLDTDCHFGFPGDSAVWLAYTASLDTVVYVTTGFPGSSTADTRLSVLQGSCDSLYCVDSDDDTGSGSSALVTLEVTAGEVFYLVFDNRYSNDSFSVLIEGAYVPPVLVAFESVEIDRAGTLRAAVDMNGDHLDDLVSIRSSNIQIQYQNQSGTFVEHNIPTTDADHFPSWSLNAGDINGDSRNDLVYGGQSGATIMLSDENGDYVEYSPELYIFCQRGNCVDINNDGLLDVFMCHDVQPNVFFINEENTNYPPTQGGLGDTPDGGNYGSIWVDYDNDGDQDLFIAKCRGGDSDANINQLHRNNGDGTFTEIAEEMNLADRIQTWSSAWADFDNDGDMDVFVGASSLGTGQYHRLMRNDDSTFTDVSIGSGVDEVFTTSIENAAHDFNNDGYVDIFGAGDAMLINNGDMTFSQASVDFSSGPIGDFNNDGFLDVANGFTPGESRIYFNQPNGNNFIKINTIGTVSNTNGIGARVEVFTTAGKQIREVRSGDGFRYMSSLNTHFGLGEVSEIDSVVVHWPSGMRDIIPTPDVNGTLTIVEGEMPSNVERFEPESINLFPNPTTSAISVPADLVVAGAIVDIFDSNGRQLIRKNLTDATIDVSQLPSGTYLLVYRSEATIRLGRFVKR